MKALQLKGQWILVTGASSGLGREIAIQLARDHQCNLVVVARRKDRLEQLKAELESHYSVSVAVMVFDLSQAEAVDALYGRVTGDFPLYGAVLNAGVTYFGSDAELEDAPLRNLVATNVTSMATLMHRFTAYFEQKQQEGALLVVSSMAALFPVPYQALYSGTKAFIYNYAVALSAELANPRFSISVFLPGGIKTEMTATESFRELESWLMTCEAAARDALDGWQKRRRVIVPGRANRIGSRFMRLIPSTLLLKKMGQIYKKALLQSKKG